MPTPPLAITGTEVAAEHRAELLEVGALERAVAPDLGDDERGDARCRRTARPSSTRSAPRALDPAPDGHLAARGRRARPRRGPGCSAQSSSTSSGLLDRGGADDDPLDARRRAASPAASTLRTPPPACTRHGDARARSPRSTARLARLTGAGGVEVDDVDPLRAGGLELARDARPGRRRRRSRRRSRPGAAGRTARRAGRSRDSSSNTAGSERALGRRHAGALDLHRVAQRAGHALERRLDHVVTVLARQRPDVQRDAGRRTRTRARTPRRAADRRCRSTPTTGSTS